MTIHEKLDYLMGTIDGISQFEFGTGTATSCNSGSSSRNTIYFTKTFTEIPIVFIKKPGSWGGISVTNITTKSFEVIHQCINAEGPIAIEYFAYIS